MIRLAAPQIGEEECRAVARVLRSGFLVQGDTVLEFEKRVASFVDGAAVAAVSNGTAALYLALAALGIGPGDAVFVPAFTFPAVFNVVELRGARPVLVDVDPSAYCITANGLRAALDGFKGKARPRAVIPVHEFGAPCDVAAILRVARTEGLTVIEDAACALGTTCDGKPAGTLGAIGGFSWHPRKGITTGEGGAVVTRNRAVDSRIRDLRNHGLHGSSSGTADLQAPSLNFRLTEFQAALGIVQLRKFRRWLARRRRVAAAYRERLRHLPGLRLPAAQVGHSWQTYMVVLDRSQDRDRTLRALRRRGIEAGIGAHAIHALSYPRKRYRFRANDFPVAAELYAQGMAIPMHPGLSDRDVATVTAALKEVVHA